MFDFLNKMFSGKQVKKPNVITVETFIRDGYQDLIKNEVCSVFIFDEFNSQPEWEDMVICRRRLHSGFYEFDLINDEWAENKVLHKNDKLRVIWR